MSKSKKKRSKKYNGKDAAMSKPRITRVSVPDRSKPAKWWHENGKQLKGKVLVFGTILFLLWLLSLVARLIF